MGSNKRDLKAYVRFDGSGRVVAGSLILRRSKPKVGKWKEIQGYQCCNGEVTINAPVDPVLNGIDFQLYCITGTNNLLSAYTLASTLTMEELITVLNTTIPYVGLFKIGADGNSIDLTVNADIVKTFTANGCTGGLVFTVSQAA